MVYACILAGGVGSRMGNTTMPKQFLFIGTKPVVIHTIEKFMLNDLVDKIIILVHSDWKSHMSKLIRDFIGDVDFIEILEAEKDKNYSIMRMCHFIEKNYGLNNDDIMIIHDAVRPFITSRIIDDNVRGAKKYGAVDTVIPAADTIVESIENADGLITNIPIRDYMYQGQTPQSFNIKKFMNVYQKLSLEESKILTDTCKIYVLKNEPVAIVMGESFNFKLTNSYDLKIANAIVEGDILL